MASITWPQGCPSQRFASPEDLTVDPDYVRMHASLAYLADELARRGYAVVIPDVNAKEHLDWGSEPDLRVLQTNLVKLHLDLVLNEPGHL